MVVALPIYVSTYIISCTGCGGFSFMRLLRIFSFLAAAMACAGCAEVGPRALLGQTAVEKLRSDLGADIDLRLALQKDIARKSAELSYVSSNRYYCGPDNPDFASYRTYNFNPPKPGSRDARVAARVKFLLSHYSDLKVVLDYGDTLTGAIGEQAAFKKKVAGLQSLIDSYKGFVPSEFAIAVKLMRDAIGIVGFAEDQRLTLKIVEIAREAEPGLKKARQRMINQGVIKALTTEESKLFRAWDVCALDRLHFLRAYDPALPPQYLWSGGRDTLLVRTAGESRSPVVDFIALYKTYLDEKEALVGRKPDYLADIDKIIDANTKIAHLDHEANFSDIVNALNNIATAAKDGQTLLEALRSDLRAAGLNV
jgi:hypothetical protein